MQNKRYMRVMALICVLALTAAACGGSDDDDDGTANPPDTGGNELDGGVYRVGYLEAFNFTNGFDPTGEYLGTAFSIYSNLLTRTLMGYSHSSGAEGNDPIPDLAAAEPEISDDGKTYTYTLKEGVNFGPPVSRAVTSDDVLYAFERIGTKALVAQYGYYYDVIEGIGDFKDGKSDTISGIETPDDQTIVFNLTEPVGDFNYRVAMPAAAPIPREVGSCFKKAGDYGRFVISTAGYMIEGSEELDITDCDSMEPISGYDPEQFLNLVRNPDYDPATDSPEYRGNHPDRFEFIINSNQKDIFDKIAAGEYEGEVASPLPQVLRKYSTDPELKDRLEIGAADRTWYITMNLAVPPFDDIHVRKAANLIMDKAGLQRAWGGPIRGDIATHVIPNAMLNETLADYDPYASPDFEGDEEAAKAEMKQSKYDTDGDGLCDADVCKDVLHYTRNVSPWTEMLPIEEAAFEKIGITLETREEADFYTPVQTVGNAIPVASGAGWGKDYADSSTFAVLFDSGSLLATGNVNYALVGLTPDQATELEVTEALTGAGGVLTGIPSVDADIDACNKITDVDERVTCWGELDKKLMEEVVPWIPYLDAQNVDIISSAVIQYEYDQFSGEAAYSKVAVDADAQG